MKELINYSGNLKNYKSNSQPERQNTKEITQRETENWTPL